MSLFQHEFFILAVVIVYSLEKAVGRHLGIWASLHMWLLYWSWWLSANPEIITFIYIGNWYLSPTLCERLLRGRHLCFGDSKVQQKEYAWRTKKARERCYCHVTRWWLQSGRTKITCYHSENSAWQQYIGGHRKTREPVKKPMPVLDYDKGRLGFHRMEQQIASDALICRHWKVCKIFLSLFDMLLFNVYVLYNNITSQKLNYNQLWLVVTEKLLDGLIMLEYARQGCPAAAVPIRLQLAHWAHFP